MPLLERNLALGFMSRFRMWTNSSNKKVNLPTSIDNKIRPGFNKSARKIILRLTTECSREWLEKVILVR